MRWAPAERLLSLLLAHPEGLCMPDTGALDDAHVARRTLEERGHRILDAQGRWRLACATQHFSPDRFAAARASHLGEPLEVWERAVSTNALAHAAAARGGAAGSIWVAEEQCAGRGRQGRTWSCPAHAGLLFSVLLRPGLEAAGRPQLLPLAVGLGACEALRATSGLDVRLKWPNDLLLRERKLGGILVEARHAAPPHLVVGVGINVSVPAGFLQARGLVRSASLAGTVAERIRREELLAAILGRMERRLADWRRRDWDAIQKAWTQLDVVPGRSVRVTSADGEHEGRALGIATSGFLRIRLRTGEQREFSAGEVHLL